MAHTNHTTNYELSQFVANDKPTFLGDYNGDMAKIDAAIKAVDTKADAADTTAESAAALATSASTTATEAATDAASANANATTALNTANGATTTANSALSTANSAAETATAADTKARAAGTAEGTSYTAPLGSVATNVKEALDELYVGGSQHGLFELWANPNPQTDYAASVITINNYDATKFDAIELEMAADANESIGAKVRRIENARLSSTPTSFYMTDYNMSSSTGTFREYFRQIDISLSGSTLTLDVKEGKQYVLGAYGQAPTITTDNGMEIPLRVLGLTHNS